MDSEAKPVGPATTTFNILFVCTGNTCRSPMAEHLARRELERRGWKNVEVASAGVSADPGSAASHEARSVMEREGLDLGAHSARMLTPELIDWADLVLTMSHSHLRAIATMGGAEKAALLGEFATGDERARGVPDPFGGEEAEYEATLRALDRLVRAAIDRLVPILNP